MDTCEPSVSAISRLKLCARMGRADAPLLLDVRREAAFAQSRLMLSGALRCAPEDIAAFATSRLPGEVVVYCVHGHQVSADAAAALRAAGWRARVLSGGIDGGEDGVDAAEQIAHWRGLALLTMLKRPEWGIVGGPPSRWITRAPPKIDRIACPWLIRRLIDPRAEFLYVPGEQVLERSRTDAAIAFDIPGAPITHDGDRCSFDALLGAFGLVDPALDRLARIVRGADTGRMDLAPESAGLLAVSLGLSRLYADDHAMLEAALPVYDALYAWCRDGAGETHKWTPKATVGVLP